MKSPAKNPTVFIIWTIWAAALLWIFTSMIVQTIYGTGINGLNYHRRSSADKIDCQKQEFKLFGLVEEPRWLVEKVTSAELKMQREHSRRLGTTVNYAVNLLSTNGSLRVFQDSELNDYQAKQAIVTQVNEFISSSQLNMVIRQDYRLRQTYLLRLGMNGLFAVAAAAIVWASYPRNQK
jgi:hypothetical protein